MWFLIQILNNPPIRMCVNSRNSFHAFCIGVVGQQPQWRTLLSPATTNQLLWEQKEAFPSQLRDVMSPVGSGSASRSVSDQICQKNSPGRILGGVLVRCQNHLAHIYWGAAALSHWTHGSSRFWNKLTWWLHFPWSHRHGHKTLIFVKVRPKYIKCGRWISS